MRVSQLPWPVTVISLGGWIVAVLTARGATMGGPLLLATSLSCVHRSRWLACELVVTRRWLNECKRATVVEEGIVDMCRAALLGIRSVA